MRNLGRPHRLALIGAVFFAAGAEGDDATDKTSEPHTDLAPATEVLQPIDLAALPPIMTAIEEVDLDDIRSGIVCRRVRVTSSLIPRTFCVTREQLLARQGKSSRERVARDLQSLREALRYQMRNQPGRTMPPPF